MNPALQALRRQRPIWRRERNWRAKLRALAVGGAGLALLLLGGGAWSGVGGLLLGAAWVLWRRRRVGLQVDERGITECYADGGESLHRWAEVEGIQQEGKRGWLVRLRGGALRFNASVEDAPALANLIEACCRGVPLVLPTEMPTPTEQQILHLLGMPSGQLPLVWVASRSQDSMEWFAFALLYCILASGLLFLQSQWATLTGWMPTALGLGGAGVWLWAVAMSLQGSLRWKERYEISREGIRRITWWGRQTFCRWRDLLGHEGYRLRGRFVDIPLPPEEAFSQRLLRMVEALTSSRTAEGDPLLLPEEPPTKAALVMVETEPPPTPSGRELSAVPPFPQTLESTGREMEPSSQARLLR